VVIDQHPRSTMEDENGYLKLDGQQVPLAEDGQGYLQPMSKEKNSVLIKEAQYSEI